MNVLAWVFYIGFWVFLVSGVLSQNPYPTVAAFPWLVVWLMLLWGRERR